MDLFYLQGLQLEFKTGYKTKTCCKFLKSTVVDATTVREGMKESEGKSGESSLVDLAMEGLGLDTMHRQVFLDIAGEVIGAEMVRQLTMAVPYIGPVKSIFESGKNAHAAYKRHAAAEAIAQLKTVDFRDPQYELAAAALVDYLHREEAFLAGKAAMQGVQGTARLAFPGTSSLVLIQAAVNLSYEMSVVGYYTKQIAASRTALARNPLDPKATFDAVPVLACWVLGFRDRRRFQMTIRKRDESKPKEYVRPGMLGGAMRWAGVKSAHETKHPISPGQLLYRQLIKQAQRVVLNGPFGIRGVGKADVFEADASDSAAVPGPAAASGSSSSSSSSGGYSSSGGGSSSYSSNSSTRSYSHSGSGARR